MSAYGVVLFLHVLAASVWTGAGLLAPRDARESLLADPPRTRELLARLRRTAQWMNASAYLTVLTGVGAIALGPGLARTPPRIFVGLGLTLLAIALGRFAIRPAVEAMVASIAAPLARADAERVLGRFAFGVHGESVLRVIVLALMVAFP